MARLFARTTLVVVVGLLLMSSASRAQTQAPSEAQLLAQLGQNPQQISTYLDLVKLYADQQRLAEAEQVLQKALSVIRAQRQQATAPGAGVGSEAPLRVGGDIKEPKKTRDVKPVYPADAQAARVQGVVIIEAVIDREGNVADAKVLRSIAMLDQAAVDAVRQWQFAPTLLNGVPVPIIMTVTVNFTLGDGF